jgi:hypothetical protein
MAAAPINPQTGLTGAQRDAATAITDTFTTYGLGSLAPDVISYLKQGYSADTVSILLQQTAAYKQRFIANDARAKAGLAVLSPAQYLATEQAYRQVLSKWGVPTGFYDQNSDFTAFLSKDISATEVDQRAQAASDFVNKNDPATLAYFKKYYSSGDMVAYALDPTRAAPLVGKAFEAANIGGAASTNGVNIGQSTAETLAGAGITSQQAQQGFGLVGQNLAPATNLSSVYGGQAVTQQDLVNSTFNTGDSADATLRINKLASQERASFGGSSGVSATALSSGSGSSE